MGLIYKVNIKFLLKIHYGLFIGGSYFIGLKLAFHHKHWENLAMKMQKIILYEVRFNPCDIRLSIENLEKLE